MKSSKSKILIFSIVVILLVLLCYLCFGKQKDESYAQATTGKYLLEASNNDERIKFLSQFGWQVSEEPIEICKVKIPSEFNDTYEKYNEIQKQQGLDLLNYKGKTCERFTYEIKNYPNYQSGVYADMLILDGKVIGGDVCSAELGGFMHGFVSVQGEQTYSKKEKIASEMEVLKTKNLYPVESSTERETLAPDPKMPNAPTD